MSEQKWKFFEYQEGEKRRDSSSDKHFGDLEKNESLIRELIQNSLDAVDDKDQPVEIKIKFKTLEKNKCIQYFESLGQHYKECYSEDITLDQKINFLILEDFNTTGLEGENADNFFEKDNIRSSSGSFSGGSHGIGKIVFYIASQINTFFAYSIYENGDDFIGTCDFKSHKIDGKEYKEDGKLKLDSENDKQFLHELFSRIENQKGLSIAIPLPNDDLKIKKLENAIRKEYYYPIIAGKLTVELGEIKINEDYILDQKGEKEELISNHITSLKTDISIEVGGKYQSKPNKSEEKILTPSEVEQITSKLQNGNISIRFNFLIQSKNNEEHKKGFLDFLITKKIDGKGEKFDFWRENLLIKQASRRSSSSSQYIVIVLIHGEDNELSSLLRKLENPSHTRWEYQNLSDEVKSEYKYIPQLVPFITQLPNKVIGLIKAADINLDSNFFSSFFPDTSVAGKKSTQGQNSQNIEPKKPEINPIDSNPYFMFRENRINNGFILSLSDKGKQRKISRINIILAYGTNKGNPFNNYNTQDFDLKKNIGIRLDHGKQIEKQGNKLSCQIKGTNFKISLSGFDPDRELKIDITEEKEE